MKIAIVGAGALGCTYAAHLARVAEVVLVVRALDRAPARILAERVSPPGALQTLDAPVATTELPSDADVVLLAVRVDQLDDAMLRGLAAGGPPDRIVVTLTPMLPDTFERARAALGATLVSAMPGVAAYAPDRDAPPRDGYFRYWTPKSSPTQLQDRPDDPARDTKVRALVRALIDAGMPAQLARDVQRTNQATTIAMFPLLLGIAAAGGSIERLLDDGALLKLALAASKETRAVAKTTGELASFASILLSFAGPFTIRAGMKLVRAKAPEALTFLEMHFGTKLRAQNRVVYESIVRLADARGVEVGSLRALAARAGLS